MRSNPTANPAEALAGLEAVIRQLHDSRRRLETDPIPGQSGDDALIYIEAAEMHLKAAHCRLVDAIPRSVPVMKPGALTPRAETASSHAPGGLQR